MPASQKPIPRVFEMFVRQEQTIARSEGGLGLGLTIVRSLVEQHGGRVRAHRAGIGKGSAARTAPRCRASLP